MGNLGKDPLREDLENGASRVSFPLATSESWSDQFQGKRKKMREWHQIVCLDQRLADLTMRKCRKGTQVLVEGRLRATLVIDGSGCDITILELSKPIRRNARNPRARKS
ncbi:single-strand DNA binding protein Ssb [Acetobacter pasteurianus subsp. pasteurianus LMG 1262 = NBRC 106471]|nr:single-strand DNA binding protein Ssb [Acetobacter pasteurianus subsp. pasteurianus LMG 1262 = NBRC 106471]